MEISVFLSKNLSSVSDLLKKKVHQCVFNNRAFVESRNVDHQPYPEYFII